MKSKTNRGEIIAICILAITCALLVLAMLLPEKDAGEKIENVNESGAVDVMTMAVVTMKTAPDIYILPEPEEPIPVEEPEPIIEEIAEEPEVLYFNVPLSEDLQDHVFKLGEENNIDPALIMAVIQRESTYRAKLMGDNGESYGLMQVQPKWHLDRMNKHGVTDLLDPFQNITVGVDYLTELFETGKSVEWVLMAYNGGPTYADKKAANGIVSDYAISVIDIMKNLERGN